VDSVAQETVVCETCGQQALRSDVIKKGLSKEGHQRYRHAFGRGCKGAPRPQVEYTEQAVEYALMPYEGANIAWECDLQRVCLNDIHRALGELPDKEPRIFFQRKATEERIRFLMGKYNASFDDIKGSRKGRGGGSWPVRELGLDYAMWADMRFHDACIDWLLGHGVQPEPSPSPAPAPTPLTADDVIRNAERYWVVLQAAAVAETKKQQADERRRLAREEAVRLVQEADDEAIRLQHEADEQLRAAKAIFNGPPQPHFYVREPLRIYDGKVDFKMGQSITLGGRDADYRNADPRSSYRVTVPCKEQTRCEKGVRKIFISWLVKGTLDHFEGVPIEEYERFVGWLKGIDGVLTPDLLAQYMPPGAML
jgi:hypothetical protein